MKEYFMQVSSVFIGVDVASKWLDICLSDTSEPLRIDNTPQAITAWLKTLPKHSIIGMEVTSHYHKLLAQQAYGILKNVYVLNPRDVKHYALGVGRRAKTDQIDAQIIRRFISREHQLLRPWKPATATQDQITSLFHRRANLIKQKQAIRQSCKALQASLHQLEPAIAGIKTLIEEMDTLLFKALALTPDTYSGYKAMETIPGVGRLTAAYLANLFARTDFKKKDQVISFLGLDLLFNDSGKKRGKRWLSKRGPSEARRLLYNAAMSAARGVFKVMYDSYRERLCYTQAIVALMRKLAKIAFGIWKSGEKFALDTFNSPLMVENT